MHTQGVSQVILLSAAIALPISVQAANNYSGFPVTAKGYNGEKTTSVAYSGQMARHALHNSLKKLVSKGANETEMMAYFSGTAAGRSIVDPVSKEGFPIKQTHIDELSTGKNLADKAYQGAVFGFPGNMTGVEVLQFMLQKASNTATGFDPLTGYDYGQLISKFAMGAVLYNQAVDNYLDEKLAPDNKPNGKPYKDGAAYTGKEHVWDEAFGYFGAPAHTLNLTAQDVYNITKQKPEALAKADANGDGVVDLKTEMAFAHAYYAASYDKGGKTNYLHTIVQAFLDGRQLITAADGRNLTTTELQQLNVYADIIKVNWQLVIAESVFKYAGSVYKDLVKLETTIANNGDAAKLFRTYAKHWGELKGFALALGAGGKSLGATGVKLNRLLGYSPVLLGNTQVTGITNGDYVQSASISLGEYRVHMIKVQKLMLDVFGVTARNNDVTAELAALVETLGDSLSAEND